MGNACQVSPLPNFTTLVDSSISLWHTVDPYRTTYTDPNGVERTWESAERLTRPKGSDIDGVGVAAILHDPAKPDDEPRILLQKQWRPPINQTVIEVPAGLMDANETPEDCAIRELKEETGYIGEVVKDKSFDLSPVMFNGTWLRWSSYAASVLPFPELCDRPFRDAPLGCNFLRCCPRCSVRTSRTEYLYA
jgi:8-oxo-dGTP pyrophosphatase MutT (NUDIX family)